MASDGNSSDSDRNVVAAAGVLAGSAQHEYGGENPYRLDGVRGSYDGERHAALAQEQPLQQSGDRALAAPIVAQPAAVSQQQQAVARHQQPQQAMPAQQYSAPIQQQAVPSQQQAMPVQQQPAPIQQQAPIAQTSSQGDWMLPAAGGVAAGAGAGVLGTEAYKRHQRAATVPETQDDVPAVSPIEANDSMVAAVVVPTEASRETDNSASAAYAAVPINPTTSEELSEAAENRRGSPGIIALNDSESPVTSLPSKPSFGDRNNIDDILSAATTPPATDALATPTATTTDPLATPMANVSDPLAASTTATTAGSRSGEEELGGNERVGAHETGTFPRVIRHDTSLSVSALHIPGEFPAR